MIPTKIERASFMDKTFFFMAGLPRSGSTLLSAILNQNPDVYASPQTDLLRLMYLFNTNVPLFESYQTGIKQKDYLKILENFGKNFYANQSQKFIIDKNRAWATPGNLELAKLLNPNPKIILPYRPILEILTSFVLLCHKYPNSNFIDRELKETDFFSKYYRPIDDARCDYLMRSNGEIDQAILGLSEIKKRPNELLLINYHDLVQKPSDLLNQIYEFLKIPRSNHSFSEIESPDQRFSDSKVYGMPSLHYVRSNLAIRSRKPEEILSDYVLTKYSKTLDFLEGK